MKRTTVVVQPVWARRVASLVLLLFVCVAADAGTPEQPEPTSLRGTMGTASACSYFDKISRRRRNNNMCSCRRRSAAEAYGDAWACDGTVVVPRNATEVVPTTTTTTPCSYCAQISRRRRNKNMCSCRRRSAADNYGDVWACDGSVVVPATTTTTTPCSYSNQINRRRREESMCSCRRRSGRDMKWMCQNDQVVVAPPRPPYVSNYDGNNPLNIVAAQKRSDNYFLIIGDWGRYGGPSECQKAVKAKMDTYVSEQRKEGRTLLAVLTVGDNFYWTGARPDSWKKQWKFYGTKKRKSAMYGIPWIATMGNHDYGDNDPYAFCPHVRPLAIVGNQSYGSHQFNRDRNPRRPRWTERYWMPDYNFHYSIPKADVEFIFVDTSYDYVNAMIHTSGFHSARRKCRGQPAVEDFLARVRGGGKELLKQRALRGNSSTTVIIQHYPEHGWSTRQVFLSGLNQSGRQSSVLGAFGHVHDQACWGRDANDNCDMVLTGGGGGCCSGVDGLGSFGGFTAVHLTDEGGFFTDAESSRVRIPKENCTI